MSDMSDMSKPTPASGDEKTLGMLAHLLGLAGYILPFGNIIGPLVLWLIKKDQSAFVEHQAKESLNFQITMTIASIICGLLFFVVIGVFLLPIVLLIDLILVIVAAVRANGGEAYEYPFSLRLVR